MSTEIKKGTLVTHKNWPGRIFQVNRIHKNSSLLFEGQDIVTGQVLDCLGIAYVIPCLIQPSQESISIKYALDGGPIPPGMYKIQPQSAVITGSPEHIAQLIKEDPSKGEATHYFTAPGYGNRYHKVVGNAILFWNDGFLPLWRSYPSKTVFTSPFIDIKTAIVLTPVKVKKKPTEGDYYNAQAITRFKHQARTKKIQNQIALLNKQQAEVNSKYQRKLDKVARLIQGAKH